MGDELQKLSVYFNALDRNKSQKYANQSIAYRDNFKKICHNMKMMTQDTPPNSLKNKSFSLKEAQDVGITRYRLNKLIAQGAAIKIGHGNYTLTIGDIPPAQQFKNVTDLIGQPAVICLLSALEYYDLTDLISKEIWVMVPAHKRTRQKGIRLLRAAHLNINIGVIKTNDFVITSIERTIVDSLSHPRQIAKVVAIEALRRAISQNKTTLSKIVDTAKRLGVLHRIQSYIEALA